MPDVPNKTLYLPNVINDMKSLIRIKCKEMIFKVGKDYLIICT